MVVDVSKKHAAAIFIAVLVVIATVMYIVEEDPLLIHPELRAVEKPKLDLDRLPRMVLAFYYPWYGTPWGQTGAWRHWDEGGHDPDVFIAGRRDLGATDYPVDGPYDSKDRSTIVRHFKLAEEAGIDGFIVSWWGFGTFEDQVFRLMLDVAEEVGTSVKLTIYYETVSGGRDETAEEVERILGEYGGREAFLKVQGKPVVFIYSRAVSQMSFRDWDYVLRKVRHDGFDALFIADSFDERAAEVFDGLHMYNPVGVLSRGGNLTGLYVSVRKLAEGYGVLFAATVLPGYDDTHVRQPGLAYPRDGGETYRKTWEAALLSHADWVLICSWNEWHEGSEIEPSVEYGDLYIRLTAEYANSFKAGERR